MRIASAFVVAALVAMNGLAQSEIAAFIEREIGRQPFDRAIWGIVVEEEDGTLLFARNADTLLKPASNRKLFTAAFADACLGPERRLRTEFWLSGVVRRGTLRGDLVIVGGGDPTLAGRFHSDRDALLAPLAEKLRAIGIRRIAGRVVADVSLFAGDTLPQSWGVGDLWPYYGAPADALAYNENVVGTVVRSTDCAAHVTSDPSFVEVESTLACGGKTLLEYSRDARNRVYIKGTVSSGNVRESELVAVFDPALYAAAAVVDFLERNGVAVSRGAVVSRTPAPRIDRILSIESMPLFETLNVVLDNSQNLYSEMLLKRAAAETDAPPIDYAEALSAERRFLESEVMLRRDEFQFADGSGLSTENLVTPRAVIKAVRYLMQPGRRERFLAILARPGSSGTLRSRLAGLEGVMRGKTGYIHSTSALSGVLIRPNGKLRYFSIIVNHYAAPASESRAIIDAIVRKLAE